MGAAAWLILQRLGPDDPAPSDAALAHLLAFALQDLHFIYEKVKGL